MTLARGRLKMSDSKRPQMLSRLLPIALLCALASPLAAAGRGAQPARTAPPFTLSTGKTTVTLDSLRGKVVMVDFWASWCGPCHHSFPWMAAMHKKYADQGLTIVAINLDKTPEAAAGFLASTPAPFTIVYDPAGKTAAAYHVQGMPTTVLVGRDGRIRTTHIGFEAANAPAFEALIQEALRP